MNWETFIWFGLASVALYSAGAAVSAISVRRRITAIAFAVAGISVMAVFIAGFWISLGRPPLRTMGETRLWYSFFVMIAGLFTYLRWRYRWILSFSTVLSAVFVLINCLRPEIHDHTLMPALQSGWFIPHVTVYMFSYSVLGCSFVLAVYSLFRPDRDVFPAADTLVYIGVAFMTFGMLSGSIWAKEAWGHYWNWDPKETWAAVTWTLYLLYIHMRSTGRGGRRMLCIVLVLAFLSLQMCWYGINWLPAAQESVHIYNRG